ncbi:hypothetical protein [Staphylococcus intermedius]|uniref:Uncharacterized protein n=1 Tax=Staphylococcus intermedius NCTC 11048 TaxID=1141106 RepID=A0A380G4U8_STAIN|nr:hypothetical protein [Staphylococcus intermedius]SUM45772.1 Uncharacterised protein [Staphylococcus intermedius NCTC 11048]
MTQFYKVSAFIFGGIAVAVLSGVAYLTYQQYQTDESLVNDEFKTYRK